MTKSSISSDSAAPSSSRALRWPGLVGVAVSLLLLWWAVHDVRLADVGRELRTVRWWALLAAVACATATFPLRTIRWRYLLRLDGAALPFVPMWHATAIGFMANNLLPARAGEVARAYAARRLTAVRFTAAAGSIAIERVFDGLMLVALLMVATWVGGFTHGTVVGTVTLGGAARGAATLFGVALIAAFVLVFSPGIATRATRRVVGWVAPERWAERAADFVAGAISGLDALRSPGRFSVVLFWSAVVWLVNAASFWLGFIAFGIHVPMSAALLLQGIVAFGVAIPSSPGYVGVFEATVKLSLALYGISAARGVPYALGYHITTFIPITLLGIWSLSRAHLHLAELRTPEETQEPGT